MNTHLEADRDVPSASDEVLVHEWRRERLESLGVPDVLAESFADCVDWHLIAGLVGRGCPPFLALRIAW